MTVSAINSTAAKATFPCSNYTIVHYYATIGYSFKYRICLNCGKLLPLNAHKPNE